MIVVVTPDVGAIDLQEESGVLGLVITIPLVVDADHDTGLTVCRRTSFQGVMYD